MDNKNAAQILIAQGANIDVRDAYQRTALVCASCFGDAEICEVSGSTAHFWDTLNMGPILSVILNEETVQGWLSNISLVDVEGAHLQWSQH